MAEPLEEARTVEWEPRFVVYDAHGKPYRRACGFAASKSEPPRDRGGKFIESGGAQKAGQELTHSMPKGQPNK